MRVKVKMPSVPEAVEQKTSKAKRLGRRMAVATLGIAGYALDTGLSIYNGAEKRFRKAELRGERLEASINSRAAQVQNQLRAEAYERRAKVEAAVSNLTEGVGETGKNIEQAFQTKLNSLNIKATSSESAESIHIDAEETKPQPLPSYDSLNAQEIINRLSQLDREKLQEVYDYEISTKDRVTVLREIELLQAGWEDDPTDEVPTVS